jgi:hypothetical protein
MWNIIGIAHNEEKSHKKLQKNKEKSVIIKTKKTFKGTTRNKKNYNLIYCRVKQSVQAQSGVEVWIHKSMSRTTNHNKHQNDRNRINI